MRVSPPGRSRGRVGIGLGSVGPVVLRPRAAERFAASLLEEGGWKRPLPLSEAARDTFGHVHKLPPARWRRLLNTNHLVVTRDYPIYVAPWVPQAFHTLKRLELAAYKCPKEVHVVAELPRTSTGKLRRSAVAEQLGIDRAATD